MSEGPRQTADKQPDDLRPEDPSHPGMSSDPAERGRQLGHENAQGGQSVGTGGHGISSGSSSRQFDEFKLIVFKLLYTFMFIDSSQPVGGKHTSDPSQFNEEVLHPGMNPDPVERGRQLGHENASGGHCVGTGGHEANFGQ
ncbi:unnamed protein product [Rotaria sp. Silwood2]|nr:unnamed protein product [Rotaria sp. Silwood2]CAF4650387.1 unnamed protein product [Rotaria sp. Silwood2]